MFIPSLFILCVPLGSIYLENVQMSFVAIIRILWYGKESAANEEFLQLLVFFIIDISDEHVFSLPIIVFFWSVFTILRFLLFLLMRPLVN